MSLFAVNLKKLSQPGEYTRLPMRSHKKWGLGDNESCGACALTSARRGRPYASSKAGSKASSKAVVKHGALHAGRAQRVYR